MSAVTRINITDLPESLRTAVREGQTVVADSTNIPKARAKITTRL
ncbi:hypothetical protein [Photorhabdus temperata]|nr:hypothetical protein [Photorhabdus temperata]